MPRSLASIGHGNRSAAQSCDIGCVTISNPRSIDESDFK
jgi:hypothetical protein